MKKYNLVVLPVLQQHVASCAGKGASENTEGEASKKRSVRVETVQLVPVDQITTFTASVEADQVNNIAPAMGGRIRKIYVDVGSKVRMGQAVAAMDAASYTHRRRSSHRRDYRRSKSLSVGAFQATARPVVPA